MEITFASRLKHAWNAFVKNKDPTPIDTGPGYYYRPDRPRLSRGNERTIVTAVYNRIALDVSLINIRHVRLDENGRYISGVKSDLNSCFSLSANIDQTGRSFIQDIVMSMFDEGCVALVPVDTTFNPEVTGSYDIQSIRTGKVIEWYPQYVRVEVYNERIGRKENLMLPKSIVAIIENPLYAVINEPNSTMQRLIRKLRLLDVIDEMNGSGKLDLIIQLPYTIRSETRRDQAERRRQDIERQLAGSKYGIAYTDGTERITQLNRAVENNLMSQVEFLTSMLYSQLGITKEIMDGTADEKAMLNYYSRTIRPIITAITDEVKRKFLTKTARTQGQSIEFFRDPFSLVSIADITEMSDKMTRNEIMTANEIRQIIGMMPSSEPKADKLQNSNLYQEGNETEPAMTEEESQRLIDAYGGLNEKQTQSALSDLDDLDSQLDALESMLEEDDDVVKHYASKYYDPVKAHEYYEKHKKLKGRKDTFKEPDSEPNKDMIQTVKDDGNELHKESYQTPSDQAKESYLEPPKRNLSTAGLNASGKALAKEVKQQLYEERNEKIQDHKDWTDQMIDITRDSKDSKVDALRTNTKLRIEQLQEEKAARV